MGWPFSVVLGGARGGALHPCVDWIWATPEGDRTLEKAVFFCWGSPQLKALPATRGISPSLLKGELRDASQDCHTVPCGMGLISSIVISTPRILSTGTLFIGPYYFLKTSLICFFSFSLFSLERFLFSLELLFFGCGITSNFLSFWSHSLFFVLWALFNFCQLYFSTLSWLFFSFTYTIFLISLSFFIFFDF